MLDFDKNEVFEGFEGEFAKKKRVRRSGGNFPAWGFLIALLALAGVVFGIQRGLFSSKTTAPTESASPSSITLTVTETKTTAAPGIKTQSTRSASTSDILPTVPESTSSVREPLLETPLPDERLQPTPKPNFFQQVLIFLGPKQKSSATPSDSMPAPTTTVPPESEKQGFFQSIQHALNLGWFRSATATLIPVKTDTAAPTGLPSGTTEASGELTAAAPANLALEETVTAVSTAGTLAVPVTQQILTQTGTPFPPETAPPGAFETPAAAMSETAFPATFVPILVSTRNLSPTAQLFTATDVPQYATAVGTLINSVNTSVLTETAPASGLSIPLNAAISVTTTVEPGLNNKTPTSAAASLEQTAIPVIESPASTVQVPVAASAVPMILKTATEISVFESPLLSSVTGATALPFPTAIPSETASVTPSAAIAPTETMTVTLAPSEEPTTPPGIFQRFINSLFPKRATPTVTATLTPEPSLIATEIVPDAVLTDLPAVLESTPEEPQPAATETDPTETATAHVLSTQLRPGETDGAQTGTTIAEDNLTPSSLMSAAATATVFVPRREDPLTPTLTVTAGETLSADAATAVTQAVTETASAADPQPLPGVITPSLLPFGLNSDRPSAAASQPAATEAPQSGSKQPDLPEEPLFFEDTVVTQTPLSSATATPTAMFSTAPAKPTDYPAFQPTRLPDTGFADQWNIPMMILVVMILLALILTVRLLRNKN